MTSEVRGGGGSFRMLEGIDGGALALLTALRGGWGRMGASDSRGGSSR